MKSIFIFVAIDFCIIVSLLFLDFKDFSHYEGDELENVQENGPVRSEKESALVPVSAVAKSDAKPRAVTVTPEEKAAERKPTITWMKPFMQEMPDPVAVPVVTTEEAEKLNEEAIEFAKPFNNRSY